MIELAIDNGEKGAFSQEIPFVQCGNTSDMLAQYLIANDFSPVYYVNRTYYYPDSCDSQEHAWLEVSGEIIDIKADQFKYENESL